MNKTTPIFLVILAIAIFYVYLDPAYADIKRLRAEEQAYINAIESVKAVEAKRNELLSKYNSFSNTDLDRLDEMLPERIDNVRLVAEINGIAQQYDIEIRRVRVAEDRGSNSSSGQSITDSTLRHKTLSVSFNFDASYEPFTDFIRDLEQSLRITDFSLVSFRTESNSQNVTYNVTLKTYWLP